MKLKSRKKMTMKVLVECIQQYRMRYVVEVPDHGDPAWACDTVVMGEAKEFSQLDLGETIFGHRVVTDEEILALCDADNDYCRNWTPEHKLSVFVTYEKDLPKS